MGSKVEPAEASKKPVFPEKTGFFALMLLTLLGLALRVVRLEFQPLWWDEGYSVWFATHSLGQMAALTAQDIHPPLYYALLRGWTLLLGTGPVALRLFSAGVGALAIPAIYLAGRRLLAPRPAGLTPRAAWLAALLLAINPLHVYYSQEVRMYGLVALLSAGILVAAAGEWANPKVTGRCQQISKSANVTLSPCHPVTVSPCHPVTLSSVLYVLLTTAALYTQYYAAFLPVGLTIYVLWWWWRCRKAGRGVTGDENARSILSGAPPLFGGAESKDAGMTKGAPASFDSDRHTTPVSAQDAFAGIFRTAHLCDAALLRWLAAQAVVAVLYLPWVLYAAPKLVPYVSQKVVQDADRPLGLLVYLARHLAAFLAGHLEGFLARYWPLALLLLIPLGTGWWLLAMRGHKETEEQNSRGAPPLPRSPAPPRPRAPAPLLLLAITLITTLLLGWAVGLRYPFFPERGERLMLLALPPFLLLVAAGLDALWARARVAGYVTLGLIGAVAGASLLGFYTVPRYPADDYRPLIARTVEQGLPEDTVFCVYPWQIGYWHSYGAPDGPTAVLAPDAAWSPAVAGALDAALARGRVWFPAHLALGAVLETHIEDYLARGAVPFVNEWYGPGTRLSAWAAVADAGQAVSIAPIRFALPGAGPQAVTLVGVTAALDPVPAANAVAPLTLTWQADGQPPILAVSVRLVDDLGQLWAQHDYESADLSGLTREDRLGLLIPAGTPPGRYTVAVSMRPKGEARPLEAVGADGRPIGSAAPLFELAVAPADRVLGPERLPIAVRQPVELADGLRFLGHSAAETPAIPGELRKVSLFWQATGAPLTDYVAFVQLLDHQGRVVAGWEAPPGAAYPTSRWASGTLIRTQAAFRPPAALPEGRYRLIAGLFRATDKARLEQSPPLGPTARGADYLMLGYITVRGRPHTMAPPQPANVADIRFGEVARLVGYDLPPSAQAGIAPGDTVSLTLHWQAVGTTNRAYTVFVHLLDEASVIRGYGDSEPGGGRFPTTGWLPGEYLADRHEVIIAADMPPGSYRLAVGLYDPATGQRLTTPDGADQVVLDVPVLLRPKLSE